MAFDVSFIYRILDKYSKPLERIERRTSRFQATVNKAGVGMGRAFGKGVRGLDNLGARLRGIPSMANAAGSALAVMAASIPVNKAIEFESAITDLDKKFEFGSLGERAAFIKDLETMGPQLGFTATEMSRLAFEAGKLNIPKEEVGEFVKLTAKAAVALDGLTIDEAGTIIAKLKGRFELANEGVELMLDSINSLADGTRTDGGVILNVIERLAGQFKTLKIPPEIAAGLAATSGQLARSPELAAQGMKMFLRELDQAKLAANPMETIIAKLTELNSMDVAPRIAAIEDQFGKEASVFIQSLTSNLGTLQDTMGIVADKTNFAGSATSEFNRKQATTEQILARLAAKWDLILTKLGEKLLPTIQRLAESAQPMLDKMLAFVETRPGIVKIAAALGLVAAALIPISFIIGSILLIANPIGLIVTGVAAAIAGTVALVTLLWDEFKAFGGWLGDTFGGIVDVIVDKFKALGGFISSGLEFFGIGVDEATISQAPATPASDITTDQAVNNRASLNGRIGIDVTGPGRVSDAVLEATAPGDLGFNVAGAQ